MANLYTFYGNIVSSNDTSASTTTFATDGFGAIKTVEKTSTIELQSTYGLSALRDATTQTNTGTVTASNGELVLAVSGASSTAQLQSVERGRYMPGHSSESGIGVRVPELPTGDLVARWGLFDESDGMYWGADATGIFVAVLRTGVETKVYQNAWNTDKLDGAGSSELTLSLARGNIFQIAFTWYGHGAIIFRLVMTTNAGAQFSVIAHRYTINGSLTITNPNLPINVAVTSTATTTPFDLRVGGRNYAILGKFLTYVRTSSHYIIQVTTNTSFKAVVSFRKKSASRIISVKFDGYDLIASNDCIVQVRASGTLTSPSWGTPSDISAAETACEVSTDNEITGGNVLYEGLAAASVNQAKNNNKLESIALEIPQNQAISLCMRTISGTGTVTAVLRWIEEW